MYLEHRSVDIIGPLLLSKVQESDLGAELQGSYDKKCSNITCTSWMDAKPCSDCKCICTIKGADSMWPSTFSVYELWQLQNMLYIGMNRDAFSVTTSKYLHYKMSGVCDVRQPYTVHFEVWWKNMEEYGK